MTIDLSGTGSLAYPIVVLRRLTEDDFLSIPDESDENLESDREEVENETRMIITKELIFNRLGEILQEKLESTGKWLSCDEFFNRDGSLVSKNTSVKWPSRLRILHLLKRKVVIALWNIMTEEKRNVKGKTRLEVAYQIACIFISPKFIKNKFKWQIEMDASGEMMESISSMASEPDETEFGDFIDLEYADNNEEFGDDRRYGRDTDNSEDEFQEFPEIESQDSYEISDYHKRLLPRDDHYNPKSDHEISTQDQRSKSQKNVCGKKLK